MFYLAGPLNDETSYRDYCHFASSCSPPWSYVHSFDHHGTVRALHGLGERQFPEKWGPFLGALDGDRVSRPMPQRSGLEEKWRDYRCLSR
jgi:hypothetical protein